MTYEPRYPYRAISQHPPFRWPGNARVAVWVIPNIEYFPFDQPGATLNERSAQFRPDVLNHSWRDYGIRVGFWRLLDCLDALKIPVTAALNSDVCDHYPQVVRAGVERGWEWMGHGHTNAQRMSGLEEGEEQALITSTLERIAAGTGTRPEGWLSPGLCETYRTPDLLQKAGVQYVADWVADEVPFPMSAGDGHIMTIPYSIEINDMELILRQKRSGPEFRQRIIDQFDALYRDGDRVARVMAIALHPFLIGQPHRIRYFAEALAHIRSFSDVWFATGSEIIRFYKEQVAPRGGCV
jgi:allantoinase